MTEHTPRAFSLYGPRWCPVQGGVHSIGYDWRESRSGIRSIAVSTRVPELSGRSFIARTPGGRFPRHALRRSESTGSRCWAVEIPDGAQMLAAAVRWCSPTGVGSKRQKGGRQDQGSLDTAPARAECQVINHLCTASRGICIDHLREATLHFSHDHSLRSKKPPAVVDTQGLLDMQPLLPTRVPLWLTRHHFPGIPHRHFVV